MLLGLVLGDDLVMLLCQFGSTLINMCCRYIRFKDIRCVHVFGVSTSAGKANDSGYFALLASGLHPRHILPR